MSSQIGLRIKAVLFIVMLVGAEIHEIQQDVRLHTTPRWQLGDSTMMTRSTSGTGVSNGKVHASISDFPTWAGFEGMEAMEATPNSREQGSEAAEMKIVVAYPDLLEKFKLDAKQVASKRPVPNLQKVQSGFAEQIETMRTDMNFQKYAKRTGEHKEALITDPGFRNQENLIVLGIKTMLAKQSFQVHECVDKLVSKLFDWMREPPPLQYANPDNISPRQLVNLVIPARTSPRRLRSLHTQPQSAQSEGTTATSVNVGDRGALISLEEGRASTGIMASEQMQVPLSSVTQSTVNLIKQILGSGMLSLPAGVASYSASPKALLPALVLMLLFALLSSNSFILISDACWRTNETTYAGAWGKTVSPSSRWIPILACMLDSGIGCIADSMILGDCFKLILSPLGLPNILKSRWLAMLTITVTVVFPLCNQKSLASLSKFSVLGVLSNIYMCFFILLRYFDGSYRDGGALLAAAPVAPKFAQIPSNAFQTAMNLDVVKLISMLGNAFMTHQSAALYWEQLAPDAEGHKLGRMTYVSMIGFMGAGLILSIVMAGGFLTFGSNSAGLILNNYAVTDPLATLARFGLAISVLTQYPLLLFSVRKEMINLFGEPISRLNSKNPTILNVALISTFTIVALKIQNLGNIAAFAGAIFCNFLLFIAPALMSLRSWQRAIGPQCKRPLGFAKSVAQVLLVLFGFVMTVIGALQSCSNLFPRVMR